MPKVKAIGKLIKSEAAWLMGIGWNLSLVNHHQVVQDLVEKMVKSDTVKEVHLEVEFRSTYQEKTHSQLGYVHAAIWPQFYRYYEEQGIPAETIEQKERIRNDVKFSIGFTEIFQGLPDRDLGEYEVPRSFAGASKSETSEQIERLLVLAADFDILIEGPEEYKERFNINELS